VLTDLRLRSRLAQVDLEPKIGKVLGPRDYDVMLTGPTRVTKPDGKPLCVYLPGVLREHTQDETVYGVLHDLRRSLTANRGMASATSRVKQASSTHRSDSKPTPSAIIGSMDGSPSMERKYCRLTAWTGRHLPEMATLNPMLRAVASHLAVHVPVRYAAQLVEATRTEPDWVIPGTPFTTVTVNNTWPTGMHTDKGDLDAGFSTIAVLRRGLYEGGQLMFPEYRVAVDLADGDLILMDAHEWHANAEIRCRCVPEDPRGRIDLAGKRLFGWCDTSKGGCGAERISVVSYFRTEMTKCGTAEDEMARAARTRERRGEVVAGDG